ncbi:MAG: signal recognition particle protein [Methylacidiphilales bacterium]|nr:signal recognition particle protein [Candidatus Methylacidiphilales bacterium]MDW8350103.1 signal recognition particle protein [Verrucomicrobiae bacterium]
MLQALAEKLQGVFRNLRGLGRISESNIEATVREIRLALLSADVNYQVAKALCDEVKRRALGREVLQSIQPGQAFVKIFHDALIEMLSQGERRMSAERPLRILLCGLNGCGKTTTAGKLARWYVKQGAKVLLVAGDLRRPAAVNQLEQLASQAGASIVRFSEDTLIESVVSQALAEQEKQKADVMIFDSAGRLEVDESLLAELEGVARQLAPQECLLVADASTGQTSVKVAEAFKARVPLTGIVLTKFDGDARGGAALSMHKVTNVPIKFLGVGEKIEGIEVFAPERLVSRVLGMGDIVGLVEKAQEAFDAENIEKLEAKLKKGKFDLEDFLGQMRMLRRLGPLQQIIAMLPGIPSDVLSQVDDRKVKQIEAIVLSMTPEERRKPEILNARRRQRIARGSGRTVMEVNELIRRFEEMRHFMAKLSKGSSPEKVLRDWIGRR